MTAADRWRVKRMTGGTGTISHPWIVLDPACPEGRHPTRDCGCAVFRTLPAALAYRDGAADAEARP